MSKILVALLTVCAALLPIPAASARAQMQPTAATATATQPAPERAAGGMRIAEGRVQRPVPDGGDSTGMGPAVGAWVTLHRVGHDSAGPVDSVRTNAAGRYRFQWRVAAGDSAVFFASVTWGGIAYFSSPLRAALSRGDDAEITVFDVTANTFPLSVKGRHLIVGMPDSLNMRTVIEVFELSNDSLRTLISEDGPGAKPTWTIGIPSAARDVRVTQGDVSQDAFAYAKGRVSVFAPMAPGLKQVAFSYQLSNADFPLQFRAENGAVVFEVLMEDEKGGVFGDGFQKVEPVTLENRRFDRYLSQDVPEGTMITVEVPATSRGRGFYAAIVLVAVGFVALLAMTRTMQRRTALANRPATAATLRSVAASRAADVPMHERLAQEIVALDTIYARNTSPSESVRQAYETRRAELKAALSDALASGSSAG